MSGELVGALRQAAMPAQRAGRQSVEAGQPKVRSAVDISRAQSPRARSGRAKAKAATPQNDVGSPGETPMVASSLTVAQLKEELKKLGLPTKGRKHDLVARLDTARKPPS